jgi:hypothetical protein
MPAEPFGMLFIMPVNTIKPLMETVVVGGVA